MSLERVDRSSRLPGKQRSQSKMAKTQRAALQHRAAGKRVGGCGQGFHRLFYARSRRNIAPYLCTLGGGCTFSRMRCSGGMLSFFSKSMSVLIAVGSR